MSPARMPDGSVLDLFGSGGGASVAARLDVPLLGSVPLSAALRRAGDVGTPIVAEPGNDDAAVALEALAAAVAGLGRGLSGRPLPVAL
jgi:ATP-binding protein involved in chromosome partitioning